MSRLFDQGGVAFELGSGCVLVDHDSPDRLAARAEPLHEDDEDWDECFAPELGDTIMLDQLRAIPRDALKVLLRFLIPPPNRKPLKRWKVATVRVALLARMVDLDGLSSLSLEQLGQELGYTRALMSLRDLEIIDQLGLSKDLLGKQRTARGAYARAAHDYWDSQAGTERRAHSKQAEIRRLKALKEVS